MASYNGASLGFIFQMSTSGNPNGEQVNAYCGGDGLEVIDHGTRGGTTVVAGAMLASSAAGLAGANQSMRSLQANGGAYVLVDTLGTSWASVRLRKFTPVGPIRPIIAGVAGGYAQRYEAEFLHLS